MRFSLLFLFFLLSGCSLMPQPLTQEDIAVRVAADRKTLQERVSVPENALTFGDVVAEALTHNLDIRMARLDTAIQQGVVDLADLQMLPRIVWNAGYTWRSPPGGSITDTTPPQGKHYSRNLELTWSILDFGISYIRARQESNNLLIAQERRRRMANLIINDLRHAYWQSLLGARRQKQIETVTADIEGALAQSKKMIEAHLQDPLVALNYQEGLFELRRQMRAYQGEVRQAEARLARILNRAPGKTLPLAEENGAEEAIGQLRAIDAAVLEDVALSMRSELREQDYQKRNRRLDIYGAYSQMLPSLIPRAARLYDSSNTLRVNEWREEGGSASWNILGIWSAFERAGNARRNVQSADLRRLALSLSVMEQTVTAHDQLVLQEEDYRLAREIAETRRKIWEIRRIRQPFADNDELERIRSAVAYVTAQINEDKAYARMQKAYGDLLASLGVDQVPETLDLNGSDAHEQIRRHLARIPHTVLQLSKSLKEEEIKKAATRREEKNESAAAPAGG